MTASWFSVSKTLLRRTPPNARIPLREEVGRIGPTESCTVEEDVSSDDRGPVSGDTVVTGSAWLLCRGAYAGSIGNQVVYPGLNVTQSTQLDLPPLGL